ncbi:3-deoxy-manno-octulosonate cytidylyltransferase [Arachidicoccus ginsenosidivorans]|jgi:3-deoxy-manno-octulosonate cytidylyltransferase (CMP-KDO synthetase)|uniref:3-deoxy-manno-octulosonate cytidylyltransferase n=1 Tax=Arachidicoccus ginsenosidivorans TaxID=496057 RepID=A0A5B8VIX3_9BACT|nr:3-deoxy-manno-octulosonate cytidylyltransferase [Arachidicoccus ginsenosidivorans]QEC70991.1 3-deoxy-manno-octulosonate cytidylyltransferase [Arachidicoccus ginsenosidivorans]
MKVVALIPARYKASRFPGKLMQDLAGKTVIRHTYERTLATGLFDQVMVATDSDIIYEEITRHGGQARMTKSHYESGSDRIAEVAADMEVEIILNVQGDTPFINKEVLRRLIAAFEDTTVQVASLMQPFEEEQQMENPNCVKVVVDKNNNSLLFSRSRIPYPRNTEIPIPCYEHKGVYAFRKAALIQFTQWEMTPLELAEKIECLRYLENGVALRMVQVAKMGVEIDTPDDLERARQQIENQ